VQAMPSANMANAAKIVFVFMINKILC
jgi:hypothetical protein